MQAVSERLAYRLNALYPKVVTDAGLALAQTPATGGPADLEGDAYCTVVTYRRSGEPVATPVWFGLHGSIVVFRSLADSGKIRRLRHTADVLVAPCSALGRPTGPAFRGTGRVLEPGEEAAAEAVIRRHYGGIRRGYKKVISGAQAVYVAVTPA